MVALVLVATVLADFGLTFVYSKLRPDLRRHRPSFRVRSESYHHGLKPGVSVDDERWGPLIQSYRTNSLGFRDEKVREVPLASAAWRVVLIGDSFTEGVGVRWEDTFAGIAGRALAPRGIEVLDAGVASFSPILYQRRVRDLLENVGLRFDHLVVFLDIGDVQDEVTYAFDVHGNVVSREARRLQEERANQIYGRPLLLRSLAVRRALERHTVLLGRLYSLADGLFTRGPRRAAAWTMDRRAFEEYGREGLARARTHMDALRALLARHGIGLTVAVYPWPDQILMGDRYSIQASIWGAWAAQRGAGFIDCFPLFFGRGDPRETVRRDFIPGDIHWNEAGHRIVAETLVEHLLAIAPPGPEARGSR